MSRIQNLPRTPDVDKLFKYLDRHAADGVIDFKFKFLSSEGQTLEKKLKKAYASLDTPEDVRTLMHAVHDALENVGVRNADVSVDRFRQDVNDIGVLRRQTLTSAIEIRERREELRFAREHASAQGADRQLVDIFGCEKAEPTPNEK